MIKIWIITCKDKQWWDLSKRYHERDSITVLGTKAEAVKIAKTLPQKTVIIREEINKIDCWETLKS